MPLPTDALAAQQVVIGDASSALDTAVLNASGWSTGIPAAEALLVTDAADVASTTAAHDDAVALVVSTTAAWVADGSPGSGATFDAKEAAIAAEVDAAAAMDDAIANQAIDQAALDDGIAKRDAMFAARRDFARETARLALTLTGYGDYEPPSTAAKMGDLMRHVAFALSACLPLTA